MFGQLAAVPKIARFIISGTLSAVVNFTLLYFLTELLHFRYLFSSICSFSVAIAVSFLLQKHWTFENQEKDTIFKQASIFSLVAFCNLLLNTGLVFVFVEKLGLWYMFAQFISSAFITVESFFLQKKIFAYSEVKI